MGIRKIAAGLTLACACVVPVQGGEFVVDLVEYHTIVSSTGFINITVEARAIYVGTVDANDNSALLQSFLNTSYGGNIYTWNPADESGPGSNFFAPFQTGQTIWTSGGEGANGDYDRPPCSGGSKYYKGKAGAAIYHQFGPDITEMVGSSEGIPCYDEDENSNEGQQCTGLH